MGKHTSTGIAALSAVAGTFAGGTLVKRVWLEKYRKKKNELTVAECERDLAYSWLLLQLREICLQEYFDVKGIDKVAIFGMNRLGRRAAEALGERAVYGVELDNFNAVHERFCVYRLGDDPLPPADYMLLCDTDEVCKKAQLARREFGDKLITLAEVLQWLMERHGIEVRDGALADWPPEELRVGQREN